MNKDKLHAQLVLYGTIRYDLQTQDSEGFRRVRVFEFKGQKYVHHMLNGDVIEIVIV